MNVIRTHKKYLPLLLGVFGLGLAHGQDRPLLPFEGPDGPRPAQLGANSFGRPVEIRGIHNESVATPDFGDIQIPPFIPTPRYYITIRYYACRPWFIHPYTGANLGVSDLITNVQSNNPDWPGQNKPLAELLDPTSGGGEPLVDIVDEGVVDENNPLAVQSWQDDQAVELNNAAALGVPLQESIRPIWHAPYYGLYCLRIRICVPYISAQPGSVYNYWVKWRYRVHQRYCWQEWWHHCWFNHPTRSWIRYPWSPMCTPCVSWHRAGPDWIMNICNVNRYRHWCLYGFRYYCNYWTNPIFINSGPVIGDMTTSLAPPSQNTSGWLRPWPYPSVRYWPFRPYCTRWFWFRPIPWYQYRYLPPLVNAAVAIPNIEFGAGFVDVAPQPNQNPVFPLDPPMVDPNTRKFVHASEGGQGGNSFFDIFVDVGECRWRALLERLGDHDGDGNTNLNDATREILITERSHGSLRDLSDDAFPTRP